MSYLSVFAVSILMMRPLTAFGVYYIRPSLYPTKLRCPRRGRQGHQPSFPSTLPNFAGGRSRLDFLLLLFLCQDKKRRRTRVLPLFPRVKTRKGEEQGLLYPVSRQEKEKNRGFAPFTPTFFSSLDGRKEGKRRSRRQGRRPSFPGTWPNFPAPVGDVRDAGQIFRVRYAPSAR